MFYGMHGHRHGYEGGPRRGRRVWGPFSGEWDLGGAPAMRDRGGGRRGRMFDGGELRLVLLRLIADAPRHGYDLIREIEELTGGAYAPSPGIVYPTLTLLDEMGLIEEQRSEGAKKRFAATEAGRAHLEEHREAVDGLMARLKALGHGRRQEGGSPVWRAVRNLGAVIRNRVPAGDLSSDVAHEIAALIDEVAQRIERLR